MFSRQKERLSHLENEDGEKNENQWKGQYWVNLNNSGHIKQQY